MPLAPEQSLFWSHGRWLDALPQDDRSSQYGDALFETIRVDASGGLPLWSWHQQRLEEGFSRLFFPADALGQVLFSLKQLHLSPDSGLKLLVSRGSSPRGYGYTDISHVNIKWQAFMAPAWKANTCLAGIVAGVNSVRLSEQPLLAGLKHTNRLEQVLARGQFQPQWDESVLLDQRGRVVEGTMSNLIWLDNGVAKTPPLHWAGVNGVIRRWLLGRDAIVEAECTVPQLQNADGLVFCNAITGLVPVSRLDHTRYDQHDVGLRRLMTHQISLEAMF